MSYPIQPYNPNNGALVEQQLNRAIFDGDNGIGVGGDFLGSLFGLANQLVGEMFRAGPGVGGISSFMGTDPNNPHIKVIGISSMNVAQVLRGPDGRPHIIQAHNERLMGPDGIWRAKKSLRDSERGIDTTEVSYSTGDHGEVPERRLDPPTGQYRQDIQRSAVTPNEPNLPHHWPIQSQQAMQRQPLLPPPPQQYYPQQQQQQQQYQYYPQQQQQQQYQYYPQQQQQQQRPFYAPQPRQALSKPLPYQYL